MGDTDAVARNKAAAPERTAGIAAEKKTHWQKGTEKENSQNFLNWI